MQTKITQGEWQVGKTLYNDEYGAHLTMVVVDNGGVEQLCIATTYGKEESEVIANSKLISAAPELLKALQFCQSVIKTQGMFDRSEQIAYEKATAAIKKATEL